MASTEVSMESPALATPAHVEVSQRELLGLVRGCAARRSATFTQAEFALIAAGAGPDSRPLARELLTDLAIRGWIEIRSRLADGGEGEIERRHWEFEFAADHNWEGPVTDCACYALTDRGRERLGRASGR
jgi:hypothetical protein